MHVRVYRSLQLTAEQRARMSEAWAEWELRRRSLDAPTVSARDCLARLPQFIPIPASFAQHVFNIAEGAPVAAAAAEAGADGSRGGEPVPWDREAVVPLLGAAADFAAPAAEALRLLWYAQEAEAGVTTRMVARRLQPGHVMSVRQQMRLYSAHLKYRGAPFVDFMALCQLAVTHQRRRSLFHAPPSPYGPSRPGDRGGPFQPLSASARALWVPGCDLLR